MSASEYRGADDGGKLGIDQDLAAHDDEAPVELRVVIRVMNAIDFASSHLLVAISVIAAIG